MAISPSRANRLLRRYSLIWKGSKKTIMSEGPTPTTLPSG
jgi:hypothetical protein